LGRRTGLPIIEQILKFLEQAGGVINLFAVAVIVVGFFLAWGRYAFRFSGLAVQENFRRFKIEL
jgi:hypothetical protein